MFVDSANTGTTFKKTFAQKLKANRQFWSNPKTLFERESIACHDEWSLSVLREINRKVITLDSQPFDRYRTDAGEVKKWVEGKRGPCECARHYRFDRHDELGNVDDDEEGDVTQKFYIQFACTREISRRIKNSSLGDDPGVLVCVYESPGRGGEESFTANRLFSALDNAVDNFRVVLTSVKFDGIKKFDTTTFGGEDNVNQAHTMLRDKYVGQICVMMIIGCDNGLLIRLRDALR
jgi:hypothetical protein